MTTVATGSAPISNLIFFSIYKYIVNQVCISHATACVIILDGASRRRWWACTNFWLHINQTRLFRGLFLSPARRACIYCSACAAVVEKSTKLHVKTQRGNWVYEWERCALLFDYIHARDGARKSPINAEHYHDGTHVSSDICMRGTQN